ncbi:hypothetical protein D3C81_1738220 [compost metagenome]
MEKAYPAGQIFVPDACTGGRIFSAVQVRPPLRRNHRLQKLPTDRGHLGKQLGRIGALPAAVLQQRLLHCAAQYPAAQSVQSGVCLPGAHYPGCPPE